MRQVREVLRRKLSCNRSHRELSASTGVSRATVCEYVQRAARTGLTWGEAEGLSNGEVEARLLSRIGQAEPPMRTPIDFSWVSREMRRPAVTLQLLWSEYRDAWLARGGQSRPYSYSQFCDVYRALKDKLPLVMRQEHRAGEKIFVDFSGTRPVIVDPQSGTPTEVELFVAVMEASNYTYAEAARTQRVPDCLWAHVRAFEYFGGISEIAVPDQLKSGVTIPDLHDPDVNAA